MSIFLTSYLYLPLNWKSLKWAYQLKCSLFTKQPNFRPVKIERICKQQNKCNLKNEIYFVKGGKHHGKRRKCWLTAFFPSPTMFSKDFLYSVVQVVIVCLIVFRTLGSLSLPSQLSPFVIQ